MNARFTMADLSEHAVDHGPMWIVAEGKDSTEWFKVRAGHVVEKQLEATVADGRLDLVFNSTADGDWIVNSLIVTRLEPSIACVPIRKTKGDGDLLIRITLEERSRFSPST